MTRKVLLHFGTGLQFSTLGVFNDIIDDFIFVDSCPQKYFDMIQIVEQQEEFIYDIVNIPGSYGYSVYSIINDVYTFKHNKLDKTIKYYTNVYFPDVFPTELKEDMKKVSHLLICGFSPDTVMFEYLSSDLTIIATNLSVWDDENLSKYDKYINKNKTIYVTFNQENPICLNTSLDDMSELDREIYITCNNINITDIKTYDLFGEFKESQLKFI